MGSPTRAGILQPWPFKRELGLSTGSYVHASKWSKVGAALWTTAEDHAQAGIILDRRAASYGCLSRALAAA